MTIFLGTSFETGSMQSELVSTPVSITDMCHHIWVIWNFVYMHIYCASITFATPLPWHNFFLSLASVTHHHNPVSFIFLQITGFYFSLCLTNTLWEYFLYSSVGAYLGWCWLLWICCKKTWRSRYLYGMLPLNSFEWILISGIHGSYGSYFKNIIIEYLCIHGHQCHEVCLEVRGQLWEVDSLLPLRVLGAWNCGQQACP